jgi:antirestriction protein ArdC
MAVRQWAVTLLAASCCHFVGSASGQPDDLCIAVPPPEPGLIAPRVEALVKATSIDFRISGSRAFYMPAQDYVQVPQPQAYFEPINWHRTALHELGHASGAPIASTAISPTPSVPRNTRLKS